MHKNFFLILVIVTGFLIFYPTLNYQGFIFDSPLNGFMAQGDHGINLYAAQASLRGELPFKDYYWTYGPLMPYYYGFFYKFLGMDVQSILIGKFLLILLSGIFVYLILCTIMTPAFSFLGAFFYFLFDQDFRHTYNHIGGTFMLLVVLYFLFLYIQKSRIHHLYCAMITMFILCMIKLNIGLFTLAAFVVLVFVIHRIQNKRFSKKEKTSYVLFLFGLTASILLVYYLLIKDLPAYALHQCFPYLREDHPYNVPVTTALVRLVRFVLDNFSNSMPSLLFSVLTSIAIIHCLTLFMKDDFDKHKKRKMFTLLIVPSIICLFNLHEFLTSGTRYHSYWSKPFNVVMICTLLSFSLSQFPEKKKKLCFIFLLVWLALTSIQKIANVVLIKDKQHFLDHKRAKIYVRNLPPWIETVTETTKYLEDNLKEGEKFFAVPYEPIYYYLTGRLSPTRQLIFVGDFNIPEEQERLVIEDLEKNNVNYIVFSNRAYSLEGKVGSFGQTHCRILSDYIFKNFEPVASFGDWNVLPGWAWGHAVKVMKRK